MKNSERYSSIVRWSEEDEVFVAVVPELPGVSGFGDTADQAVAEAQIAAALAVGVLRADGHPVPAASCLATFSGQFRVRPPRGLHRALAEEAVTEGVSLNTLVVQRLSEGSGAARAVAHARAVQSAGQARLCLVQGQAA